MNTAILRTQWQQLPEGTIRRLQAEKLHRYLRQVVLPFSPYYQALFAQHGLRAESIRTLEDWQQVPFTRKDDLVAENDPLKFRQFILTPDAEVLARRPATVWRALRNGRDQVRRELESEFRPIFMTSTTGRSADPVAFLFTQHDLDNLGSAGDRVMQVCGAQKDFRLLNMFPYAPHLAFWLVHYAAAAFGVFSLGTGGGKVMGTDGNLRLLRKIKPQALIGMPTFLYHVLQQAVDEGVRCDTLQRLVLGGEKVADGMRRKLRLLAERLGSPAVDVVATYGFTEAKMAFAECPHPADAEPSGYHLFPDLGVVEVIDPKTGQVLPPEHPGEIVFTPLDARGSVVLRYRTGDFIEGGLTYEPCPYCRRAAPRLVGRISRSSEFKTMQLDKIKGTLVDFNQLEHVLDDAPHVGAWQLEIRKVNDDPLDLDELILHVQRVEGVDESKLCRDLNNRMVERTEVHPNRIVFHDLEQLKQLQGVGVQLKEQKIIDNRPPATKEPASSQPSARKLTGQQRSEGRVKIEVSHE